MLVRMAREEETPEEALQYLNRLGDALFVWSRWVNARLGVAEVLWEPNQATAGNQSRED
jgi:cob(I)alamin adenosyltransferase